MIKKRKEKKNPLFPSTGLIAPLPRPQLWRGRFRANILHGKEARRLLAQRPEVDDQLLPQHPH